ncbi:serine/threonine protein kinase ['Paenibacillus yunnanensis' Narsing Rao et al. 2020]|uniref:serine/threonine protein kinase n=1 Tax=Paenibacillus tengchongensis TaxID=2608684 RepID=UPI00124DCF55|nr:serine/threonine protein kinase [Paenibacillus tengchongensis]
MEKLVERVQGELMPEVTIESVDPQNPVQVSGVPKPWKLLGNGNYAAVFCHPEYENYAVKIYAPGRPGLDNEQEVYRRLGSHPAYAGCCYAGSDFLILERLRGMTFYDCMKRGVLITEQAVRDIDHALDYARSRGLHPHDVHAKNVMLRDGRGVIVDVSDFLNREPCTMWEDYKKVYYRLYKPIASRRTVPVPRFILEGVRKGYRLWRHRRD